MIRNSDVGSWTEAILHITVFFLFHSFAHIKLLEKIILVVVSIMLIVNSIKNRRRTMSTRSGIGLLLPINWHLESSFSA